MKNLVKIGIGLGIIGIIAVGGFLLYTWIAGGSGELSVDITEAAEQIDVSDSGTLFRIVSENSEASFTLQEDLLGVRTDVIGRTTQVGGDIVVNFDNPAASDIGTIRINSRSFATDQEMRNRALRNNILQSAQEAYEFIDFVPTSITNMPESVNVGDTITFDVTGDLTIVGETNPTTFTVEVAIVSETEITGTATTTVTYGDWGIAIPSAPGVANVTPDVTLQIDFEAVAVDETAESTEAVE